MHDLKAMSFTECKELIDRVSYGLMDWRETGRWEVVTQGNRYVVEARPASCYGTEYISGNTSQRGKVNALSSLVVTMKTENILLRV